MKKESKIKAIYIEGAQSTGKTTLIKKIKDKFPSLHIANEVARLIIKEKNISHEDLENNKKIVSKFFN
ncbi:MAG: Cytidylate kinase [Mycoplasmataceae bacterium]|nr:MAG: Cytidylate kinase [Mycoplasmataceae bacterium]